MREEWERRQKEKQVPSSAICIGRKDDRIVMYGGTMLFSMGAPTIEPGDGVWLDPSMQGRTFGIAGHDVTGNPKVLYLLAQDHKLVELPVWSG